MKNEDIYKSIKRSVFATGLIYCRDEEVIFVITDGMIQEIAKSNLGRTLTKLEMNRVSYAFVDDSRVMDYRDSTILQAIFSALDNKDNAWSVVDEPFRKGRKGVKNEKK